MLVVSVHLVMSKSFLAFWATDYTQSPREALSKDNACVGLAELTEITRSYACFLWVTNFSGTCGMLCMLSFNTGWVAICTGS